MPAQGKSFWASSALLTILTLAQPSAMLGTSARQHRTGMIHDVMNLGEFLYSSVTNLSGLRDFIPLIVFTIAGRGRCGNCRCLDRARSGPQFCPTGPSGVAGERRPFDPGQPLWTKLTEGRLFLGTSRLALTAVQSP